MGRLLAGLAPMVAALALLVAMGALACDRITGRHEDTSGLKVAKVDTDYVYEINVIKYLEDYRQSRRARVSTFVGFSPDEILRAREDGIDKEVRSQVKRLPGVEIRNSEVTRLADDKVEQLAWQLHRQITQEGADFDVLAGQYSDALSANRGGQLQPFGVVPNPEAYQTRTYSMKVGEISEPFSAWDGWRIIRLDSVADDSLLGKTYTISMILLKPDIPAAEAEIVDRFAAGHTIEILDPKYNARRALQNGDFQAAMSAADEALGRNSEDDLAHYLKARALWGLDRKDEALEELQRAADVSRAADSLTPYYYFYKGQYLQELGRADDALQAYHTSFDNWRQDMNLGYDLLAKFNEVGDQEYKDKVKAEIDIMAQQDAVVLTFGLHRGDTPGGVIMTGEGQSESSSQEYEPGYAGKD